MKEIKILIHPFVIILLGLISFLGKAQNPDFEWKKNFDYLGEFHGDCAIFRAKESDGGNLGLVNRVGKILLPPIFRQMYWKTPGLVEGVVQDQSGAKSGLFNCQGQQILEPKFHDIESFSRGISIITSSEYLKGVINEEGKLVVPVIYSSIEKNENHPFLVLTIKKSDESFSSFYSDTLGNIIGGRVFEQAELFQSGVAVVKLNGKFGLVDQQLKFLIPPKFSGIYRGPYGLLQVEKDGKYGLKKVNGTEVIPCQYLSCDILDSNRFVVQKNKKFGIKSAQDQWIIPPIYDQNIQEVEGMKGAPLAYRVNKGEKTGIIGSHGQILVPLEYEEIVEAEYDPTHSYGLMVKKNGFWGMINRNGKEIATPIYEAFSYDFDGHGTCQLVLVQKNNQWGCLDTKTGKEKIPTKFSSLNFIATEENSEDSTINFHIYHFRAGMGELLDTINNEEERYERVETGLWDMIMEIERKRGPNYYVLKGAKEWKILNLEGNVIYDQPFSYLRMYFHEGLLPFQRDGKWGFIDSLGREAFPPQFETPKGKIQGYFSEGKAWVTKSGESYYINTKGEKIENQDD